MLDLPKVQVESYRQDRTEQYCWDCSIEFIPTRDGFRMYRLEPDGTTILIHWRYSDRHGRRRAVSGPVTGDIQSFHEKGPL